MSNIAEGAEQTDRNFCRFLTIALGSCAEVETQVIIAGDLGLVSPGIVAPGVGNYRSYWEDDSTVDDGYAGAWVMKRSI